MFWVASVRLISFFKSAFTKSIQILVTVGPISCSLHYLTLVLSFRRRGFFLDCYWNMNCFNLVPVVIQIKVSSFRSGFTISVSDCFEPLAQHEMNGAYVRFQACSIPYVRKFIRQTHNYMAVTGTSALTTAWGLLANVNHSGHTLSAAVHLKVRLSIDPKCIFWNTSGPGTFTISPPHFGRFRRLSTERMKLPAVCILNLWAIALIIWPFISQWYYIACNLCPCSWYPLRFWFRLMNYDIIVVSFCVFKVTGKKLRRISALLYACR